MASSSALALVFLAAVLSAVNCQFGRDRRPGRIVQGCAGKAMDIFFILDSSSSIYIEDFTRERNFVRDIVSGLDVSPQNTRVGMLTYSDEITLPTVMLGDNPTQGGVLRNINEDVLPYRTGNTHTHEAIRYVRNLRDFRRDVAKVIVVVTDGGSRMPATTAREAQSAREAGFYLFVVGVGNYLDDVEWRAIATDPDECFIFNITNMRALSEITGDLASSACSLGQGGRGRPPVCLGSVSRVGSWGSFTGTGGRGTGGRGTGDRGTGGRGTGDRGTGGRGTGDRGTGGRGTGTGSFGGASTCRASAQSDLYFMAAPGAIQDAVMVIDSLYDSSSDRDNRLSISYFLDNCEDSINVPFDDLENYCDRNAEPGITNVAAWKRQLKSLSDTARRNKANGAGNQVVVLFLDKESMDDSDIRFAILDATRDMTRKGIKIIVVDLGVSPTFQNYVSAYRSDKAEIIKFRAGGLVAQRGVLQKALTITCEAINKIDFTADIQ